MARRASRRLVGHFRTEWMFVAGCALIVVFGIGVTRELLRRQSVNQEVQQLEQSVQDLHDRKTELQQLIAEFQQSTVQEREARTKLGLVRPGEKTLIVESTPTTTAPTALSTTAVASTDSNPRQWWQYFFGS